MGLSGSQQIMLFIVGIVFFPFLFYATFVYATVPGFLFSLIFFHLAADYEQTAQLKKALLSALSMAFAVFLKQNSLIFLIALFLYSSVKAISLQKIRLLCLPFLLVILIFSVLFFPQKILEHVTGKKLADGISSYSYIVMGAQDGERAPGWYNGYVNAVYGESGLPASEQRKQALADYADRLQHFRSDPSDGFRFFLQKRLLSGIIPHLKLFG